MYCKGTTHFLLCSFLFSFYSPPFTVSDGVPVFILHDSSLFKWCWGPTSQTQVG